MRPMGILLATLALFVVQHAGAYDIDEIRPAFADTDDVISVVVVFGCSLPTDNPQGEQFYVDRDGSTINLVVSTSWLGLGLGNLRCTPPPMVPYEYPLGADFDPGEYVLDLYIVDNDTTFPADLDGEDAVDTAAFFVGPLPAVIPVLGGPAMIVLGLVLLATGLWVLSGPTVAAAR